MQFGLCNAASTFQRFIDEVTRGLKGVYAFIDDILIASQNVQEHTTNLRALFERLDYYGLTIKPSKCTFGVDSLKFLGIQVSSEGHTNKKKPSHPSKNPQTPLEWTEEAENSFTAAKTALADATLLKHPIPGATLSVWTDASNFAIGSSLVQLSNSNWEPIAFLSLKLSKTQQNWSTYDRELLAIYTSIKKI
ncbi:transposon Ty3-I Gag-Pol polyprotein [Trichonephila clavipes]|nr:transposon Ty3-I Gag-Pol polyprotein [Trichonephila clavipes]